MTKLPKDPFDVFPDDARCAECGSSDLSGEFMGVWLCSSKCLRARQERHTGKGEATP